MCKTTSVYRGLAGLICLATGLSWECPESRAVAAEPGVAVAAEPEQPDLLNQRYPDRLFPQDRAAPAAGCCPHAVVPVRCACPACGPPRGQTTDCPSCCGSWLRDSHWGYPQYFQKTPAGVLLRDTCRSRSGTA